ncbi:MAG: rubrerythrin family protein [Candidatus Omnitrophica bacterium]|nr:rubrerythrin family protein [Candidatus Omnitrophota bacterium]
MMKTRQYVIDEYADHQLYKELAAREKDAGNTQALLKLAEQEHEHYLFWKKFLPGYQPVLSPFFLAGFRLMRRLCGLTFTVKFLERREHKTVEEYKRVAAEFAGEDKARLEKIISDENEHENFFIGQIQETVIKYIGFIALGLADAIVEVTGVHAGFLGVTSSTLFAGISGVIVGFSAAISMGSAAYLQAKHDPHRSAWTSAVITGVSYIFSVVMLAVPYFLTRNMSQAFMLSTLVGMLLIALLTFYSAVVFDRRFWREFLETVGLMLATAAVTFVLGVFIGKTFGIQQMMS